MKYIRKFDSAAALQAAIQAGTIERPFVAWDGDTNAATINVEYGNTTPPPPPVYDHFIATLNIEYEDEPLSFIYENCGQLAYTPSKVVINGIEQEEIKQYYYAGDGVIVGENIVEIWIDPEDSRYYTMDEVFRKCTELTSVIIPNYVTSIGYSTFDGCTNLTSINNIPNNITSIGHSAFASCGQLTSITIPNTVTSIGVNAFYCSGITSIVIPNSITYIDGDAFHCCSSLTSITVEAIIPPTLYDFPFNETNNCPIYVPASSVDTYKAATGWSNYANRIQAMQ